MINWKLEKRKLSQLKDYHKNPRQLTKSQENHLITSLEKFGVIDKPIINQDNTLIGGHQRKRTLKKLGFTEIECWVPDQQLNEKQVEELNIRLNQSGEFDYDILANEYELNDLVEYGFPLEAIVNVLENELEEDTKTKKKKKTCPHCGEEL